MNRNRIDLPPRVLAGLRRSACTAVPAECCGALVGEPRGGALAVRSLVPLENEAVEQRTRFAIDARTVLRVERQSASAGLQLLGFYHSHPQSDALPSALDLEQACPGFVYVIVDARSGAVRAWQLRDERDGFDELAVAAASGDA